MKEFERDFISLISNAFNNTNTVIPDSFDWERAFSVTMKHQLAPVLFYGVLNSGAQPPSDIMQRLEMLNYQAIAVNENQLWELKRLTEKFDENKIDYMPLKGSVLKHLYPHPEMRLMGDADILIKPEQYVQIRNIMIESGYTELVESDHELIWDKKGKLHVELHKRLIPSYNKDYYAYFGDGWRLAVPSGNGSRFVMSDEDQFIYIFTHFTKHYRDSGIGIRHFLDLHVYLKAKPDINREYIKAELVKLQLDTFYNNIINTLDVWFDNRPSDEITDFITEKIILSGVYGIHENSVLSQALKTSKDVGKKAFKIKILLELMFLPYKQMCKKYDFLKKIPVLLPVMWVVRLFTVIFCKRKSIRMQSNNFKMQTAENIDKYQQDLNFVGLDYNFK